MKTYCLAFVALVATALAATSPDPSDVPFSAHEWAQGFRDGLVITKPKAEHRARADGDEPREGFRLRRHWARFEGMRVLELPAGESAAQAIARLMATGRYEFVTPVRLHKIAATPNDPSFSRQWSLANSGANNGIAGADIHATAAWDVRTDAPNVIVAVIDTGVKLDHPDLAANLWRNTGEIPGNGKDDDGDGYVDDVNGINAIANNGDPSDDAGHGTHVAGIIGAVGNNGVGIAGVAWHVQIMPLKFLKASGGGDSSDAIECINYAIAHGAHIINASYGSDVGSPITFDQAEMVAIRRARDAGIIFVAAAGNADANLDFLAEYPASFRLENVIAVGNVTSRDDIPVGTNFGSGSVELFAPGTDIYSTWFQPNTPYMSLSGTSMAAPHVSGALALLKAEFPDDTYRQLINRLLRNVDPIPALAGKAQTGGRLNLDRAIRSRDNRPFNDDFATRARVSGSNLAIRSVNTGATMETEPAIAGQVAGATLWWEWTATATGVVRISTTGSSYDTLLGVFTGGTLDALAPVASNDDEPGRTSSRLEFTAQAGTTYQIVVGGKGDANGLTLLDLGAVPSNDNFAAAQNITGRSAAIFAANALATLEPGEPRILNLTGGKSLWYRWTAPSAGRFQFSAKSDGFDPILAVYTGSTLDALQLVGASDNADAEAGATSTYSAAVITVNATAGAIYSIQVDGKATGNTPPASAPFTLVLNDSLWQAVTGDSVTCAPTVGPDGAVYVGSSDGFLHGFNADGTRRWPAINVNEALLDTSAAALATDGTLYFGASPTAIGDDAALRAVNTTTGALKWQIKVGDGSNANNAVALAADGTIYVHSDEGRLFAFTDNGTSATQKWSATVPGTSYASAVIAPDGTIYLGSDDETTLAHKLYAFNPDGTTKWTFPTPNPIYTAVALDASGNLYFGTLADGRLYSLPPSGGQPRWVYSGARTGMSSSPALSPDGATVYFGAYDGFLHAVNTTTGAQRWRFQLGKEVRASSPAVDANGVVYVGCYDGLIYAINADGTLRRTWATGNIVRSSPAIAGTTLFVGSNDNGVYAFDIGAGPAGPWPQYRHNARRVGRAISDPVTFASVPKSQAAVVGDSIQLKATATAGSTLAYQWFKDGQPIAGATRDELVFSTSGPAQAGNYLVVAAGSDSTASSAPAAITIRGAGEAIVDGRLVNLSVRTTAGTAAQTLIVGFFLSGAPDKAVLIRAIGPTLAQFGVTGALADPRLQLLSGSSELTTNDNWGNPAANGAALAGVFAGAGAFALDPASLDAAIVRPLGVGGYTAQVAGAAGTGIALAELYDTAPGSGARLTNVSARSQVNTGGDILIAGFSISGNAPKTILVRGIGPTLATFGVNGALADPKLTLFRDAGKLADNDNWATRSDGVSAAAVAAAFGQVGAFTLGGASKDAALLVTLVPGSYTAQLSGVNGTTGVGLVEVYEIP